MLIIFSDVIDQAELYKNSILATDPHGHTQTFVRATRSDKYSHPPKADKTDYFFVVETNTHQTRSIASMPKFNLSVYVCVRLPAL